MRWNYFSLSDDTQINISSIAFGNGYYVASCVRKADTDYVLNIIYTKQPKDGWQMKVVKNAGVDNLTAPDIVFTGTNFVIPYTTGVSNSFNTIHFTSPEDEPVVRENIFHYPNRISINSASFINDKIVVCGLKDETAELNANTSAYIWFCNNDPAGEWTEYNLLSYDADQNISGDAYNAVYNAVDNLFCVYVLKKENNAKEHRIYKSADLQAWNDPTVVSNDVSEISPQPTLTYCKDYNSLCLFLHGNIYISRNSAPFEAVAYPEGIGAESVRAAVSDGTKFLASSGSDNQAELKVMFSNGNPLLKDNWHVEVLSNEKQLSYDVEFFNGEFVVLGGYGADLKPAMYTAPFNIDKFKRMKDRVPKYPGRVELTQVGDNKYTLKRADEPTDEGTKLGKAALLSDDAAIAVWNNTPPTRVCTPSTALEHLGGLTYHVGDILTTARDLSGDENWLPCTGGDVSETDYPELYKILTTGSVSGDWPTNVIDNQASAHSANDIGIATDGEWYVMVTAESNYPGEYKYDYNVYYTKDPGGIWTKRNILTASQFMNSGDGLNLIYANGYFAFIVTGYTSSVGNQYSYIVYTDDPSKTWHSTQLGSIYGYICYSFKYLDGQYIAVFNGTPNNVHNCIIAQFDTIGGTVNTRQVFSGSKPSYIYDIDFYNNKWCAVYLEIVIGSSNSYESRLYFSDSLDKLYTDGNYIQIEYTTSSTSSTYDYFQPSRLACGNGYYLVWGYRAKNTDNGRLNIYYNNSLTGPFQNLFFSQYWGLNSSSAPVFFNGAFYAALRGVDDSMPYIAHAASPDNWTFAQLFNATIYRPRITVNSDAKTLYVGTQSQNYTTLTAAWKKIGKSLPKITPGVGLNAYIRAKEGD